MNQKTLPSWELEEAAFERGFALVCGCDEAGAGPLELKYLNDSKQVTPKRRDQLFEQIKEQAAAWAVASVSPEEIDATDILSARIKAMQLSMDALSPAPDYALIDGNRDKGRRFAITTPHETVLKGDSRSISIAAASILAKVSRDRYMEEMAEKYPLYRFEQHKGYGTKLHYQMLDQYGPSPIHRLTFLKKWEAARHG